ncbi:MAG: radical SAM protein [Deltaproteobacteria bacterium]|nr:radical SAM protein [Deltaproteobacteria bacterium]
MRVPWPVTLLHYYIQVRLQKQRRPILGGFKITHRCNLRCIHCPFWKRRTQRELEFNAVRDIMHQLHRMGVRILILEGGEPFLWCDGPYTIYDVVEEARRLFMSVGLTTNGTFPLDVPASTIWVSMDGLEATHDAIRGPTFHRVLENIRRSNHTNIYANITINRLNVHEIPDLIHFLSPLVRGCTIQFHYPYTDDGLCVGADERRRVLDRIMDLKRRGAAVADSFRALRSLRDGGWRCHDWMLANVDPNGQVNTGCYVRHRGPIACRTCGFAAHVEISQAFELHLPSILVGARIFHYNKTALYTGVNTKQIQNSNI